MDLFKFRWRVPRDGYAWITSKDPKGRFLVEAGAPRPVGEGFYYTELDQAALAARIPERQYDPFTEERALFRVFAEIETTEKAILTFANRYGWLHRIRTVSEGGSVLGISFAKWEKEILRMRRAVELWDSLLKGEEQAWWHRWGDKKGLLDRSPHDPQPLGAHFPTTLREFSLRTLQDAVNERLAAPEEGVPLFLDRRDDGTPGIPLAIHAGPQSLLAAMWILFAIAIAGNRKHLRCPHCKNWFEPAPRSRRRSTTYCSTACRVGAYRVRKINKAEAATSKPKRRRVR